MKKDKFSFEAAAEKQAERIYEKLSKTEPGTKEYKELQNQLGAFEIMKEKRNSGKVTKSEWAMFCAKFITSALLTGVVLTADFWIPQLSSKLKIEEFVSRLVK